MADKIAANVGNVSKDNLVTTLVFIFTILAIFSLVYVNIVLTKVSVSVLYYISEANI